jgi:SAM-dependent methyltransferase
MNICLAATWYPRGEYHRFIRFLPMLEQEYAGIVVSLIPSDDQEALQQIKCIKYSEYPKLWVFLNEDGQNGRYTALMKALETPAEYVHYVDLDRLLHWIETRPDEWKRMVAEITKYDCIIFGRTSSAYLTHPQALTCTEKISNLVVSNILKMEMDVSAGSKSFNRSAAQYIVDHCHTASSIGTDAEWPIRLKQGGFRLEYILVDGLDWESADQYKDKAVIEAEQAQAAADYDADPEHWAKRVDIAQEIIRTAVEISQYKPFQTTRKISDPNVSDWTAVFDVDDYLYFYSESLTDERTDMEVDALVRLLNLDKPKKILDLACGFGRHTNRLAKFGHNMTGVDITPGFLEIARHAALKQGVNVRYQQNDMRTIKFDNEFDCVLLLFTAFGYFSDEENLQVLVNARNALIPGGALIFDIPNRDTFLKRMQSCFVVEKDGNMMIDRMSFDSLLGRSYNRRVVFRDGIRKDKPFSIRLYNPNEITTMISRAGLVVEHIYDDWESHELTMESSRLVVIAHKPVPD